ncbi:unnamed protein product [Sphagnum tenellum]
MALLAKCCCWGRASEEMPVDNNKSGGGGGRGHGTWRIFSLRELYAATSSFNRDNQIGEGGFGSVYWGRLPNGDQIAVKRLKEWSTKAEMEFAVEVEILGRVRHKNLLSLRGYCAEGQERLIVYDYMPKRSLLDHLHDRFSSESALNWQQRMKIATGSAEGLAYLHHYTKPHIIHRDIKASNILLDENFEAQLADFGFAKLIPEGATHVTTRVKGTLGYLAPEYATWGKVSEMCDVYSFGILLLELISGRRPIERTTRRTIVEWAGPLVLQGNFHDLVDPKLCGKFHEYELTRVVQTATMCAQHSPANRPTMQQVVEMLKDLNQESTELQDNGSKDWRH